MLKQKSSVPPCSKNLEFTLDFYSLRRPVEPTVRDLLLIPKNNLDIQSRLFFGAGSRTRTYELRRGEIYSLLRLPLRDSSVNDLEPRTGFEPVTSSLPWMRSTN